MIPREVNLLLVFNYSKSKELETIIEPQCTIFMTH